MGERTAAVRDRVIEGAREPDPDWASEKIVDPSKRENFRILRSLSCKTCKVGFHLKGGAMSGEVYDRIPQCQEESARRVNSNRR